MLVADGASADIAELIGNAPVASVLVAPSADALACITDAIAGRHWDVLHIVAHGRAGAVALGGQWIDARTLAAASGLLIQWRVSTIALWSCHAGRDATLAELLGALTGAQVLISAGPLGMLDSGPAWQLHDVRGGALPAHFAAPFDAHAMRSWPHRLAVAEDRSACRSAFPSIKKQHLSPARPDREQGWRTVPALVQTLARTFQHS